MKLSIITTTYNSESTILDTLNSLRENNNKKIFQLENIFIDGGSKDNTINLIKCSSIENFKIISEPDKGIYDAMNKGIELAQGEVIGILNSDDLYYSPDILSLVANEFKMDENLDILFGDLVYVDNKNINLVIRKWKSSKFIKNYFENGNVPPHPSLFLRKRVYKEAGNFNLKLKFAADYEFMLRIFNKYSFKSKYINRYFVKMRLGGATNKSLKNILIGNYEIILSWKINGFKIPILLIPKKIILRIKQFNKFHS